MANVTFSHPRIKPDLEISVNPDQVTWAYGLNTAVYPTYGGEVVQILSVFFDDMTIAGTVSTVSELEHIYTWFIRYMQDATQGTFGASFDQIPVTFSYPDREWTFTIWPKAAPGFKYGRDVVAPTWTLIAAVKEPDPGFVSQVKDLATFNATHKGENLAFGKTTADFGLTGDLINNPWASPDADPSNKGQTMSAYTSTVTKQLNDTFSGFLGAYQANNLGTLPQFPGDISKAADPTFTGLTQTGVKPSATSTSTSTSTSTTSTTASGTPSSSTSSPGSPPSTSSPSAGANHQSAEYKNTFNSVFNALFTAWKAGGCNGRAFIALDNKYGVETTSLNPNHLNANQFAATSDALASFVRSPYGC